MCLIVAETHRSIPDATAVYETSTRKRKTGGCGGRTMYSAGATNSTVPSVSSGRSRRSRRSPFASSSQKYSLETAVGAVWR